MKQDFVKKNIIGVGITNADEKEVLEYILTGLETKGKKYYIVTPNPEILVYAHHHLSFKDILNRANLALNDGIGLLFASRILGKRLNSRVTGVDLMEHLCREVSKKPITVGFLGGRPGVAELTAECLIRRYPGLKVIFAASEWSPEGFKIEDIRFKNKKDKIINHKSYILNRYVDILFVAFGFPKQEEWMSQNLNKTNVRVMMGVGGAFDYISGKVPRAPRFIQNLGFEWLFRLLIQPWRIKRQLALIEFLWLVLKERFRIV